MTDGRELADERGLKQCGRCAAWIPSTATMCAYCGTSSPDARIDPRPSRTPLGLPPWVTVTRCLIAANCLWFVVSIWVQFAARPGTKLGPMLVQGDGFDHGLFYAGWYDHGAVLAGQWWRVLTATFLHAGILHLGMNMWALKQLGEIAEDVFGGAKLLAIYTVCGIGSTLAVSVWFAGVQKLPPDQVPPLVGASGAIVGVGGLVATFLLRRGTERGREIGRRLGQNLLFLLVLGYLVPFISNTGHVGGLIPGALLGLVVRERFSTQISPQARRNWWLAAVLAAVASLVALGCAANFTIRALGGAR